MREKDTERMSVLRMLFAEIINWEKRGDTTAAIHDDDIMTILRKEAKKRREAASAFRAGERSELAEKEEREAATIDAYLPAQMSEEDIRTHLAAIIGSGISDFGVVMKEALKELRDRADAAVVSKIARELLS